MGLCVWSSDFVCGLQALWSSGSVVVRLCGPVLVRLCGRQALWSSGSAVVMTCGRQALWSRGSVVVRLCAVVVKLRGLLDQWCGHEALWCGRKALRTGVVVMRLCRCLVREAYLLSLIFQAYLVG